MRSLYVLLIAGTIISMVSVSSAAFIQTETIKASAKSAVGECPPKDTGVPVYLRDSDNCSLYYECSNGEAVLNTCPPDMLWNTHLNTCDWAMNVDCEQGNTTPKQ